MLMKLEYIYQSNYALNVLNMFNTFKTCLYIIWICSNTAADNLGALFVKTLSGT